MTLDSKSIDALHRIFREKMLEVYRENYKEQYFSNLMTNEFNAWQRYLRESLKLEVAEAGPDDRSCLVWDKDRNCSVKLMNPSNGASFGNEFIIMSSDFAEKALVMGGLPERM